jgi:two-component system sensor histidine kinase PilS (NtrC family)
MSAAGTAQQPIIQTSPYPLPVSLTRRVLSYLSVYRLVIALLLLAGNIAFLSENSLGSILSSVSTLVIMGYVLFAAFELFMARRAGFDAFSLARYTLLADVLFLALLRLAHSGPDIGLGTLLVFCSALAGMLLPLRMALFIASVASLSMIGQAVYGMARLEATLNDIVGAGLYGATAMVACLLCHHLAFWARDYRLIAEKQETKIADLQEVNELIIRNMNTGIIAVDTNRRIKLMNEYAWFLLGSPKVRELLLSDLSPRLDRELEQWQTDPGSAPKPLVLEPSQAQVAPDFASMPGTGYGVIFLMMAISRRAAVVSELLASCPAA